MMETLAGRKSLAILSRHQRNFSFVILSNIILGHNLMEDQIKRIIILLKFIFKLYFVLLEELKSPIKMTYIAHSTSFFINF